MPKLGQSTALRLANYAQDDCSDAQNLKAAAAKSDRRAGSSHPLYTIQWHRNNGRGTCSDKATKQQLL